MPAENLVTAEQLLGIREPGCHFELVRGELRRMSPAGYTHGVVIWRIAQRVGSWVEQNAIGVLCGAETGFMLERDPDTVRAPDVAFVRAARHREEPGYFPGPPDLAVEVVSPGDTFSAVQDKALSWLEHGTKLVWVVDPDARTVTIYGPDGNRVLRVEDTLTGGELLPGLAVPVAEFFAS